MKCPICGGELKQGKKNPEYLLCYHCRKRFKKPERQEKKYSNIPPKEVQKKREHEVKKAYEELLAIEDDSKPSYVPVIILAIAILALAAAVVFLWLM